jgi:RNA-splicing ligase RtcB
MDSFQEGDLILQYNRETDTATFEKPLLYIVKECESFYHFKNSKGLDQMVSEEHKMLIWKGYKSRGYSLQDMKPLELLSLNLDKGYYGIKTAFQIESQGINITDNEIRLDIMVAADGTIRQENIEFNQIELHFSKERKIIRARQILSDCSIIYKEYQNSDETISFSFNVPKYINKDLSKYWIANKHQLKIIMEECLLWDGHSGYRSFFSSTNKINSDIIQFAFSANNIRAGISIQTYPEKENWSTVYIVTPTKNNIIGVCNNLESVMSIQPSIDGKKYCFTTRTGYFIARRNGKIFITGNCGVNLIKTNIDFEERWQELDKVIRRCVPSGRSVHQGIQLDAEYFAKNLHCWDKLSDNARETATKSLGTLGGGNHFIEAYKDGYLSVHSGSRNLGLQVAKHYQGIAEKYFADTLTNTKIANLKDIAPKDRQGYLEKMKSEPIHKDLLWLEGSWMEKYLEDMNFMTWFAGENRRKMLFSIIEAMGERPNLPSMICSTHNYIGKDRILRKGAIAAYEGQKLVIPLSMRDGMLICTGKGNEDWNFSAPHGAGRLYSRSSAKRTFTLEQFEESMIGIHSTTINESTIDEAPFVYKNWEEIARLIEPTVEINERIIPIYNFKSSD